MTLERVASRTIKVEFATNRNRLDASDPEMFGMDFYDPNDKSKYVTGRIQVVKLSNQPDTGWAPDHSTLEVDPNPFGGADLVDESRNDGRSPGASSFISKLSKRDEVSRRAQFGLVLIHGYSSSFWVNMSRAAQIATAYGASEIFVISWPSDGYSDPISVPHYLRDRAAARDSAKAIAKMFAQLAFAALGTGPATRPRLNLVAHSMGVYALRGALQIIKASRPDLMEEIFEGAFLMCSDEDYPALGDDAMLKPLFQLSGHVATYWAETDYVLWISQQVNGIARLGNYSPFPDAYDRPLPDSLTSIDCRNYSSTTGDTPLGDKHYGHQYYRLSPVVIEDVKQVLAGIPPTDIEPRLPDPDAGEPEQAFYIPMYPLETARILAEAKVLDNDEFWKKEKERGG